MTHPTSRYLDRPLRTEEEARRELRCKGKPCFGTGYLLARRKGQKQYEAVPCPICNPSREEDNG